MKLTFFPTVQGQQYMVHFRFSPFALLPALCLREVHPNYNTYPDPVDPFWPEPLVDRKEQIRPLGTQTYELRASPCRFIPASPQGAHGPFCSPAHHQCGTSFATPGNVRPLWPQFVGLLTRCS